MLMMDGVHRCTHCGNSYSNRHNLSRHRKTCVVSKSIYPSTITPKSDMTSAIPSDYHKEQQRNTRRHDSGIANYSRCNEELLSSSDDLTGDESSDESTNDESFDICNYSWCDDGAVKKNHSFQLPRDIRAIIVGKSGSGKTTLLNSLLLKPDALDYENLMICGKSLHQSSYKIMQLGFDKGLSKTQIGKIFIRKDDVMEDGGPEKVIRDYSLTCKGGVDASFFDDVTMIPDPSEHDSSCKNLLVLDDIMLGPQNKVEAYFTRGRHSNVDVIYITQSYFRLPRQTIRENGNLFMFFPQDRKNLIHIFNDHCAGDGIQFESFSNFCNDAWRESPHNFVTIDLSRTIDTGKYRKNLNYYWLRS